MKGMFAAVVIMMMLSIVSIIEHHRLQAENAALKQQIIEWQKVAALVYEARWPEIPGSSGVRVAGPLSEAFDTPIFKPEDLRRWLNPCRTVLEGEWIDSKEC